MNTDRDHEDYEDEDWDEDGDAPTEREIADLLQSLVTGDIDKDDFDRDLLKSDDDTIDHAASFEDAGVLTSDKGFRFNLPDGRSVYVTVQVQ
jgi:hypothetical protein